MIGQDILAVDIETVIDRNLVPEPSGDDQGPKGFPPPPAHRVVAISYARLHRGEDGRLHFRDVRSGGEPGSSELELIEGFWRFFSQTTPTLLTWNGRGFDVPVLLWRGMRHGIAVPTWFEGSSRYENYDARYAPAWHSDLMDLLSGYGASPRVSLDLAARAVGAPGKLEVDGSDVERLIGEGRIDEVRGYCDTDVLNLVLVWLAHQRLRGVLTAEDHDRVGAEIRGYLEQEQPARRHLGLFLEAWSGS